MALFRRPHPKTILRVPQGVPTTVALIREYVEKRVEEWDVSKRKIALAVGVSPAAFYQLLAGERPRAGQRVPYRGRRPYKGKAPLEERIVRYLKIPPDEWAWACYEDELARMKQNAWYARAAEARAGPAPPRRLDRW